MNKLCFYLVILSFGWGCNSATEEDDNSFLYGEWMLVNVSGGIAGDINEVNTETETHTLQFSDDNSTTYFYNDSLVSTNKFHLEKRKSIYSADELNFIIYKKQQPPDVITYLSLDTLALADNYYDGYTRLYIKQSN